MDHPASEAQLDTFLWFLNLKMFCLHGYNPLKIMSNFKQEITYRVQKSKCHEKLCPFTFFPHLPLLQVTFFFFSLDSCFYQCVSYALCMDTYLDFSLLNKGDMQYIYQYTLEIFSYWFIKISLIFFHSSRQSPWLMYHSTLMNPLLRDTWEVFNLLPLQ